MCVRERCRGAAGFHEGTPAFQTQRGQRLLAAARPSPSSVLGQCDLLGPIWAEPLAVAPARHCFPKPAIYCRLGHGLLEVVPASRLGRLRHVPSSRHSNMNIKLIGCKSASGLNTGDCRMGPSLSTTGTQHSDWKCGWKCGWNCDLPVLSKWLLLGIVTDGDHARIGCAEAGICLPGLLFGRSPRMAYGVWRLSMERPGLAGLQEVDRRLGQAGSSCGWRPAGSLHRVQLKTGETQHALRQAATRV